MSIVAKGSSDRPPSLGSTSPSLPSVDRHILIKFGDFESTDVVASQAPGIELRTELNYASANSIDFADQRSTSNAPSTPARGKSPLGKEGHATQVTPPYKARSASASAPASPRTKKGDLRSFAASDLAPRGGSSPGDSAPLLRFESEKGAYWSDEARSFYGIGDQKRLDQRNRRGPCLQDDARVAAAQLHHASNLLQLQIESRRNETALIQLQVQAEKTATAKAQLAVEKARNRGRQLDIELELKSAATATAKSDRDVARDVARQADLNKQVAVAQLKKDAAQLQLDAQDKRAVTTDLDLQLQQRQMARAYVGLQQTRLRNEQDPQVQLAVDAALVDLGVIKPYGEPQWDEPELDFQCTCGFSTEDPAEVDMHLDMHADEAEKEAARADKEERFRLRQAALKAEIEQGKQRIAVLQEAHHLQKEKFAGFDPDPTVPSAQEKPKAKRKKAKP